MADLPSVAIAGAGLSGLCLAQSLLAAGFDVDVYERDPAPQTRRQGYRITVDAQGIEALRRSLPARLFELVIATAGEPRGSFRFMNRELGELFSLSFPDEPSGVPPRRGRQMDRLTLRTALLSGLEGRVHFGKAGARVELAPDGATLVFEDGTSRRASLVVGADGVHSALRQQLLPDCNPIDTGSAAIYGRSALWQGGRSLVPASLAHSGVLAIGSPGRAFFFTTMHFHESPRTAFARLSPSQEPPFTDDYVMWGIVAPSGEWPPDLHSADPRVTHGHAIEAARAFHPALRRFVDQADVDATLAVSLRSATRPKKWPGARATLMGDSVHVMPPFGAHGGNTALRDAALLSEKLRGAVQRGEPLEQAVAAYQQQMLEYAFKAVKSAQSMMGRLNSKNPILRGALRVIPWLRGRRHSAAP